VVALIVAGGWRLPFLLFGLMGLIWAAVWFWYYRDSPEEHASVNPAELELIRGSSGANRTTQGSVPWRRLLADSGLWYLSSMYFCYGYCLAVYLDWFPTYLKDYRGFTLAQMGFFAMLPMLAGTAGDLAGGWISDILVKRSNNLQRGRRVVAVTGFLIAGLGIVPATLTADPMVCVAFSCLAFFGLELTVGVSWAIPLDIGGDFAGSVSAVMNTMGNIGGAISPTVLAYLVESHGWNTPFLVAAVLCLFAAILYFKIDATRRIAWEAE
jgi:sugar phosphate permease